MLFDNRKVRADLLRVEWLCGHVPIARKGKEVALSSSHAPPPAPAGASHPAPSGGHGGAPGPGHQAHVQKFCAWIPGKRPWEYLKEHYGVSLLMLWTVAILATVAIIAEPAVMGWAVGVLAIPSVWLVVSLGARTFLVPSNSFAVRSSGEVLLPETYGPGLHPKQFGDEILVVRTNPITVSWSVKGVKLKDQMVLQEVGGQTTIIPEPRIAGGDGVSILARWLLEGRVEGDDGRLLHNLEHGIQGGIESLLVAILTETSSEEFDASPVGLELLIQAELACHSAPHHDDELLVKVGGPPVATTGTGGILKWYQDNHAAVKEWLEGHEGHFASDPKNNLTEAMISHHESHVGSTHDHTRVTLRKYTAESEKLLQSKKAAELKGEGAVADADAAARVKAIAAEADANAAIVKARADAEAKKMLGEASRDVARQLAQTARDHAEGLKALGVTPDAAATAGNAVVERGNLTGTVLVGGGGAAATGADLAAGMNAVNNPPPAPPAGGTP